MNKSPIKIAQFGVSHAHASGHAAVMRQNPDVDFCGVYEPDDTKWKRAAETPAYAGPRRFAAYEDILSDPTIAAIAAEGAVCENLAAPRAAVEAGKHVWLDKPAGNDLAEFRRILDIAQEKRLCVQLGYMFRYNDGFQRIVRWAESGFLGEIFAVRGRMSTSCNPQTREALAQYPGGILFELLCHLIDVVVTLLGRPERVTRFLRNDLGTTPGFQDNTLAVLEYDRAMAWLESAAMEVSPFPARRFEVYGTKGSAIVEPLEPPSLRLCLDESREGLPKGWSIIPVENRPRYVDDLGAFVADIRGEKSPDRTLEHEFVVQETVLRASSLL